MAHKSGSVRGSPRPTGGAYSTVRLSWVWRASARSRNWRVRRASRRSWFWSDSSRSDNHWMTWSRSTSEAREGSVCLGATGTSSHLSTSVGSGATATTSQLSTSGGSGAAAITLRLSTISTRTGQRFPGWTRVREVRPRLPPQQVCFFRTLTPGQSGEVDQNRSISAGPPQSGQTSVASAFLAGRSSGTSTTWTMACECLTSHQTSSWNRRFPDNF